MTPRRLPEPLTPAGPEPMTPPAVHGLAAAGSRRHHPGEPGLRRTVLTASLAALLVMGGAVAVVSAASPAPAASSAPTTTDPSNPASDPSIPATSADDATAPRNGWAHQGRLPEGRRHVGGLARLRRLGQFRRFR